MDLFEALCLWCLTFRLQAGNDEISRNAILWHKHRTLTGLQKRISAGGPTSTSDETIIITLFLANIAGREGRKAEADAHYHGLRRMTTARGGLIGNSFSLRGDQIIRTTAEVTDPALKDISMARYHRFAYLNYPKRPFSQRLYTAISTLPRETAELALTGKLSTEVISILASIQQWLPDANVDDDLARDAGKPSDQPETEELQPSPILHVEGLRLLTLFTSCVKFARSEWRSFSSQKSHPDSFESIRDRGRAMTRDQPAAPYQLSIWIEVMGLNYEEGYLLAHMVTQSMAEMIGMKLWHGQSSPRKKAVQGSFGREDLVKVWDAVWSSSLRFDLPTDSCLPQKTNLDRLDISSSSGAETRQQYAPTT